MRRRAVRLLAGAGACAAGGVVASETRLEPGPDPDKRPIEILVHNISHSDMLVMLGEEGDQSRTFLARPVFNKFQPVSEAILHQIATLKVRTLRFCCLFFYSAPGPTSSAPPHTPPRCTTPHHSTPRHATPRHATPPSTRTEHGQATCGRGGAEQVPGSLPGRFLRVGASRGARGT